MSAALSDHSCSPNCPNMCSIPPGLPGEARSRMAPANTEPRRVPAERSPCTIGPHSGITCLHRVACASSSSPAPSHSRGTKKKESVSSLTLPGGPAVHHILLDGVTLGTHGWVVAWAALRRRASSRLLAISSRCSIVKVIGGPEGSTKRDAAFAFGVRRRCGVGLGLGSLGRCVLRLVAFARHGGVGASP